KIHCKRYKSNHEFFSLVFNKKQRQQQLQNKNKMHFQSILSVISMALMSSAMAMPLDDLVAKTRVVRREVPPTASAASAAKLQASQKAAGPNKPTASMASLDLNGYADDDARASLYGAGAYGLGVNGMVGGNVYAGYPYGSLYDDEGSDVSMTDLIALGMYNPYNRYPGQGRVPDYYEGYGYRRNGGWPNAAGHVYAGL
ncbi:hypothetical protein DM01DRAFT_1390277, partial [Hesseltinella vesiculosa]